MTAFAKILLSVIVTVILAPTKISLAQAITITHGAYELESLDSAPGGLGSEDHLIRFIGTDHAPARGPTNELQAHCDLDPQSCIAISGPTRAHDPGISNEPNSISAPLTTAGGATEFSESTAIILLIVGLIGLSRLRGRPIK